MNIFRYWAWVNSEEAGPDGRPYSFTLKRGSDLSQEDARQKAERASKELMARIRDGGEPPAWYEYSTRQLPEPILDEIHDDAGQRIAAVTINRFGCEVLNTQNLAFLDIDLVPLSTPKRGGLLARMFGGGTDPEAEKLAQATAVEGAISQLRSWVARNAGTAVRVYRTSAGLRYLFVSPTMNPGDALHQPVYEELGCDPLYRRLCVAQDCFRARLSPKPWRIGVEPSPVWRVDRLDEQPQVYEQWHSAYLDKARHYAACELLETVGAAQTNDPSCERLILLHDERSGVGSGLPLA
ncbi:MAG: hypothetical protein ACF8MJ_08185 [Phycisphaerales bacterium JB050]